MQFSAFLMRCVPSLLNPRHGGGGRGANRTTPLHTTFDTIHPIDLIFGTITSFLYFQLIEITWCLIDFHGNHN